MTIAYAHSVLGHPVESWERLGTHTEAVGRRAAFNAGASGWADVARAAGHLHDIGKCSALLHALPGRRFIPAPAGITG